jgi:hypothetical protein
MCALAWILEQCLKLILISFAFQCVHRFGFTTRRCGPSHYVIHSFFSGLDQFHYSDIWPNVMVWTSDRGCMATIGGTLMDWSSDTI